MDESAEVYFPLLGDCLSGRSQLISWEAAFYRITSSSARLRGCDSLLSFLSYPESIRILSNPLGPYPKPSDETKSAFDSKIKEIPVDATTEVRWNVDDIKEDALWLSKKALIDQVSALRLVILERQTRSEHDLLNQFSDEEISSLQDAIEVGQLSHPTGGIQAIEILKGTTRNAQPTESLSQDERRLKIYLLYLSEKRHVLKLALYVLSISLRRELPNTYRRPGTHSQTDSGQQRKMDKLATLVFSPENRTSGSSSTSDISACIEGVRLRLSDIHAASDWLAPEAEYTRQLSLTEEVVQIMQMIFLRLEEVERIPSSQALLSWLRMVAKYDFFDQNSPASEAESVLFSSLQALTSIITLSFLKLRLASVKFDTAAAQPYRVSDIWGAECPSFLTPKDVGEINEIFLKAAESERLSVSPALFAWGTIMFSVREIALSTREERELQQAQHAVDAYNGGTSATQTLRENHSSVYEDAFERARNPAFDDDFVKFMISIAVDRCRVFDVVCAVIRELDNISGLGDGNLVAQWARVELLDLIRASLDFVEYIPELLTAVLQIITTPNTEWDCTSIRTTESRCEAKAIFLHDDTLMGKIFRVAKSRFPYEAINFLKLCRSLIDCNLSTDEGYPLIFQELESMDTYTQIISAGFQGYQSTREDENANFVSLIEPLEMKELSSTKIDGGNPVESQLLVLNESSILPADTLGQVVNDSKPAIIMWQHRYNCISFLGVWLEQATSSRKAGHEPDDNVVAEIIGLLADLVASSQVVAKRRKIESCAKRILEVASDGLNHHGDIITAVFDIFERNLQTATTKVGTDRGLEIITGCTSFLNALVTVIPGRVWPFLTRSSLLAGDGAGGTLPAIVSAVEVNTGDFSFLLETIRTFRLIVDDAVRHLAVRKTAGNVTAKSAHVTEYTAAAPSHIMSSLLQSFVRVMVDIYNNSASWRYNDIRQLLRLNTSLTDTFQDIIYYTYGVDDTQNLDSKLTAVFANSARYLLSMLRPSSKENIFFNPVLRVILSGFQNPLLTGNMYLRCLQSRLVESSLKLSITLIQAGSAQHPGTTGLERQLFNATPVLIRLYVLHQDYQLPIVNLLELLVTHASLDPEQEPPSLLGHLGGQSSCRFLDILSKFDRPFHDIVFNTSIWKFLTAVISRRQQWLAVLLLTGTSPRDALKKTDQTGTTMKSKPFLDAAIDTILGFRKTSRLMVSALEFIAKAQESWPWATPQLAYHSSFLPRMADYIASINIRRLSPYEQCMTTKLASLFADICAVYLHRSIERGERSLFKALIPLIQWYAENAIEVDGYNASLHTNLRRNFEMKYPGCNLFSIKKTTLSSPTFGKHFFYDIVLGTKVFGYEFAWIGSRNQGFVDEVQRANENLSLVQAQMDLLHSFKFLAIEHCADFIPDRGIQRSITTMVRRCLEANSRNIPNESFFHQLHHVRAEFALGLLQRLVEIRSRGSEVFGLLQVAWDATRFRNPTYEAALANDDMEYYGMLLNILFLALQFHDAGRVRLVPEALNKKAEISGHLAVVLDIVRVVVAQGFRSLTTYLHDEPHKRSPKDFALLTAILQSTLRVKNVNRIYEQIAYHLAESDTIRYACTLFSWSYKLTVEGDPIYGELSILYLLELSCLPLMAEQMAVEGIFVRLSTYQLTDVFRQPQGCGPFDQVPRLYTIWYAGFLPLCLNLLYHVGRAASEVTAFLNQFEGQLRRASEAFSIGHPTESPFESTGARGLLSFSQSFKRLSLGMTTEACSLALISLIIEKFRDAGPSAGADPRYIQELKWDRARVKEDIEVLLEKKSILRSRITPTNEKEVLWSQKSAADPSTGAESLLEEKIVKELHTALSCIEGGE